ncbi:VWA domain-containing protein [Halorutilales archaeon Cl-col2-1]
MEIDRREKAQVIIVAGFLVALGIIGVTVMLNSAAYTQNSIADSRSSPSPSLSQSTVEYEETVESGARDIMGAINQRSIHENWTNAEVRDEYNRSMRNYTRKVQRIYAPRRTAVDVEYSVSQASTPALRLGQKKPENFSEPIRRDPLNASLVIDTSGSMEDNDPNDTRVDASKDFVGALNSSRDNISVLDFDQDTYEVPSSYRQNSSNHLGVSNATYFKSLPDDENINETIDKMSEDDGSTYIGGGIRGSLREFDANSSSSAENVTIILTDGQNEYGWVNYEAKSISDDIDGAYDKCRNDWAFIDEEPPSSEEIDECDNSLFRDVNLNNRTKYWAREANRTDTTVHTVGLGDSVNGTLLKYIATETGGNYNHADNADELTDIFRDIAEEITSPDKLIADNITQIHSMRYNVTEFNDDTGNFSLLVQNQSTPHNRTIWRMDVENPGYYGDDKNPEIRISHQNESTNTKEVLENHTYNGTPVEIGVTNNSINSTPRNLHSDLLYASDPENTTYRILIKGGNNAKGTYDIQVDSHSTSKVCGSKTFCSNASVYTVGALQNVRLNLSYSDSSLRHTNTISAGAPAMTMISYPSVFNPDEDIPPNLINGTNVSDPDKINITHMSANDDRYANLTENRSDDFDHGHDLRVGSQTSGIQKAWDRHEVELRYNLTGSEPMEIVPVYESNASEIDPTTDHTVPPTSGEIKTESYTLSDVESEAINSTDNGDLFIVFRDTDPSIHDDTNNTLKVYYQRVKSIKTYGGGS